MPAHRDDGDTRQRGGGLGLTPVRCKRAELRFHVVDLLVRHRADAARV
jgi:hypothetical protein